MTQASKSASAPSSRKLWGKHSHKDDDNMFLHNIADMNVVKADLQNLMDNFKKGKLKAIGTERNRSQMDNIQVMQTKLAYRHFELDDKVDYSVLTKNLNSSSTDEIMKKQNENMVDLMTDLESLSNTIKSLEDH